MNETSKKNCASTNEPQFLPLLPDPSEEERARLAGKGRDAHSGQKSIWQEIKAYKGVQSSLAGQKVDREANTTSKQKIPAK